MESTTSSVYITREVDADMLLDTADLLLEDGAVLIREPYAQCIPIPELV